MRYQWFKENTPVDELGQPLSRAAQQEEEDRARSRGKGLTRGEKLWILFACFAILFASVNGDLLLELAAFSFLVYESRILTVYLPPTLREPVANGLRGFSLALFFGTLFWAFL